MIRLSKRPIPAVLARRGTQWTDDYVAAITAGGAVPPNIDGKYRKAAIRNALYLETNKKCAYCESEIVAVRADHIEHILPRKKRPDLFATWENLTLACSACNIEKSDYYEPVSPLLNPYVDEPGEHLLFNGGLVLAHPNSELGWRTVEILGLYRAGLIEARNDRILRLHPLVRQWANERRDLEKELLRRELWREAGDEREHAAAVRSYLVAMNVPSNEP